MGREWTRGNRTGREQVVEESDHDDDDGTY